jgi:hypothetical protein
MICLIQLLSSFCVDVLTLDLCIDVNFGQKNIYDEKKEFISAKKGTSMQMIAWIQCFEIASSSPLHHLVYCMNSRYRNTRL